MAIDRETKKMNQDWIEKQEEMHKNHSEGFLAFGIVVVLLVLLLVLNIIL